MDELALNILDIAYNSIRAQASQIDIKINWSRISFGILIRDNSKRILWILKLQIMDKE